MGSWRKAATGSAGKIATDTRLAGDNARHQGGESETGISTPVSRRGFLAALAIAAGLGLMGASDALAYAPVDFGPGAGYIGPSKESGDLTHPDRTRGANDRWFGYANNWDLWNIYNDYSHRLGYAFAMVFECDWSDELYDHIVFRPFYYCISYCATNPWRGYWLGRDDGDDNKGTCYIDGVPVGNFVGNLINDGSEDVFAKREDGTWRRLVFKGYMPDRAGGGRLSRQSRWNATRPSTPCGRMRSRTASPRQRTNDGSGRRCGLLPEPAHVPDGRCA